MEIPKDDLLNFRFRGQTGIGDDHKYYCKLEMWNFEGTELVGPPWEFGPFDSEETARGKLEEIAKGASDAVSQKLTGKDCDEYYDMRNGGVKCSWKKQ